MLRQNIVASYFSQAYVTLIGIVILPLYIKFMGAEAYGLIGFFTLLQAWFSLLDLGLTPTIARETSRFQSGVLSKLKFKQLYRALSAIFLIIALIGGLCLFYLSDVITNKWLSFNELNDNIVQICVQIMAISVAFRWMGGLYRGVITGSESIVWLSSFNSIIATIRFIGVFVSMYIFGFTAYVFFVHQLAVAILEFIILFFKAEKIIPRRKDFTEDIGWSFEPIRSILSFALTIAFTSSVWVFVTQTDKLLLSGLLPLAEYGYFTLAVLVASAIMVASGPISNALMPRMVKLYAEDKKDEMLDIYRKATQVVTVIAIPVTTTFVFSAKPLLVAWTGDILIAEKASPILQLYAIGNGFLVLAAFPFYLQYAIGSLKYHFLGNILIFVILMPSIYFAANNYGGIGAAWVWLLLNAFMFFFWVSYVHQKLFKGLHIIWLLRDVLSIALPTLMVCYLASLTSVDLITKFHNLVYTISFAFIGFVVALLASSNARNFIMSRVKNDLE